MIDHVSKLYCSQDSTLFDIYIIFNEAGNYGLPSGIALVVDNNNVLIGIITDGDIRRAIVREVDVNLKAFQIMQNNPIVFEEGISINDIIKELPQKLTKHKRKSSQYLNKIVIVNKENKPVRVLDYHELWEQRVASHRHLVVIGLGYVGLTMAAVLADANFLVTGVDLDETKLNILRSGNSYIHEIGLPELLKEHIGKKLLVNNEIPDDGDVFIISVGTPVEYDSENRKRPVMTYLDDACKKIGKKLKRGNLVVLRSTVPVGTCRNFVKAKLEEISGLTCGIDFHLSFAPERTAEGKALKELRTLPQIIGGYNNDSLEATAAIFRELTPILIRVESLEAAEMAKLINNTFRDYVFAYSNQVARIASKFNINIVDVIRAANEGYPRDTVPLPSPGVGGPCLTKDPHIFASVANQIDFDDSIFINGRYINELMHNHVADSVIKQLRKVGKNPADCNVLICGLAFKGNPETGDIRNSSSIEIADLLQKEVNLVTGYDAIAIKSEIEESNIVPVDIPQGFNNIDAVLFLNNHKGFEKINVFDMVRSMNDFPIIYDGWNLFRYEEILLTKPCVYMGLSFIKSSI